MTPEELQKEYHALNNFIIDCESEIERLQRLKRATVTYYSSPSLDGLPTGSASSPTERIAISQLEYGKRIDNLIDETQTKLKKYRERKQTIDNFIDNITDNEVRSMVSRYIRQRTSYSKLADDFYVSRNYVSKRIKEFVQIVQL